MVAACRETHQIEQLRRPRPDFAPVAPSDQPRQADVFESGELGQQVMELEDEADTTVAETRQLPVRQSKRIDAAERNAPAVGARERPDDLQQRRLARAAGADDRYHLAAHHFERHAAQHLQRTVAFAEPFGPDHHLALRHACMN